MLAFLSNTFARLSRVSRASLARLSRVSRALGKKTILRRQEFKLKQLGSM